jgi:serine/threonine protein kinase
LNIAIDVARVLENLHYHCQTPIQHCDFKQSNVLVDDEMIGHVEDFGLARFSPKADHNSSANQLSSIGIRGIIGYAALGEYSLSFLSYSLFSSKNTFKFEEDQTVLFCIFFIIKNLVL